MIIYKMNTQTARLKTFIGFAIKANKIIWGTDYVLTTKKRIYLIICDTTLKENSLEKLNCFADERQVKLIMVDAMADLTARNGVKVIAIRDRNLADAILKTVITEVSE